jgi:hypothetical protein
MDTRSLIAQIGAEIEELTKARAARSQDRCRPKEALGSSEESSQEDHVT